MISSLGVCSVILGLTAHIGFKSDYNFVHPSYKCQSEKILYGVYLNSEGSLSYFLGKEINSYIDLGYATGYSGASIVSVVRFKYKKFFVMPGYDGKEGIALGIEIPIGE